MVSGVPVRSKRDVRVIAPGQAVIQNYSDTRLYLETDTVGNFSCLNSAGKIPAKSELFAKSRECVILISGLRGRICMLVTSYGLFWRADEIEWFPGQGNGNEFRLLGRIGKNRPGIRVADFRRQQGIYILFDEYGPAYVGLAKGDRLGARLRDHHSDHLNGRWERFSWFGFNPVGLTKDKDGILSLNEPRRDVTDNTSTTIGDLEALLIAAMGPKLNQQKMRFEDAERWDQIGRWEWEETYQARIAPAD